MMACDVLPVAMFSFIVRLYFVKAIENDISLIWAESKLIQYEKSGGLLIQSRSDS